eukprot:4339376-Pyramimonas_sp.AAC.1
MPTTSATRPRMYDEYPTAWILEKNLIAEEEARGYMNVFTSLSRNDWVLEQKRRKGMHGTTLSEVPGIFGERNGLALAANSGTMVDGMLTTVLGVGSSIKIIGTPSHGHAIKKLNLAKRLHVSGVGHGAAVCDKSLRCKMARKERGARRGHLLCRDLIPTQQAEGSGETIQATLGLR